MFTGMIQQVGFIKNIQKHNSGLILFINCKNEDFIIGESIAIDGVCLTLVEYSVITDNVEQDSALLKFDVSPETIACSRLYQMNIGDLVNIERSLKVGDTIGGHYVLGHVDTTAAVISFDPIGDYKCLTLGDFWSNSSLYLIPKASLAVNGVSLTLNDIKDHEAKMMLIPHTLANTNLGLLQVGARVNIEFDYLARIVGHQLSIMQLSNKQRVL